MASNALYKAVKDMGNVKPNQGTTMTSGLPLIEVVRDDDPITDKKLRSDYLETPKIVTENKTAKQINNQIKKFREGIAKRYLDRDLKGIPNRRDQAIVRLYGLKEMRDPETTEVHVLDSSWNKGNIMTPFNRLPKEARNISFKSNAHVKFQDSSLGGSFIINPKPQFTRYADVRANDLLYPFIKLKDGENNGVGYNDLMPAKGMGRYYSESLDDHKQMVYLQFGVPKFNGLVSFFLNAVTYEDVYVATYGRKPYLYQTIEAVTTIFRWIIFPVISGLVYLGKLSIQFLVGNKPYMYYYLEPAMHVYWSTVNTVATHMGLSMGLLGNIFDHSEPASDQMVKDREEVLTDGQKLDDKARILLNGKGFKVNKGFVKKLNAAFGSSNEKFIDPDTGFVDVYYMATRHQQRANTILKNKFATDAGLLQTETKDKDLTVALTNFYIGSVDNPDSFLRGVFDWLNIKSHTYRADMQAINTAESAITVPELTTVDGVKSQPLTDDEIEAAEKAKEEKEAGSAKRTAEAASVPEEKVGKGPNFFNPNTGKIEFSNGAYPALVNWFGKTWAKVRSGITSIFDKAFATVDAVARGAASYLILQVNYTGGTSESFSNSTGEIQTGGAVKGFSQALKHKRFSFSGGQTGIDIIDSITSGAVQVLNGVLDGISFGLSNVIRSFLMGALVDMPKIWEDSSMSLPNVTYTMDLISPYANPFSRFQNIIVPLATLLAGTLPIRAGKAAYTSPFLCSCYSKSVQHIRLGMITDLSINRGITNLAYCNDRVPNGITVSFTVTDFAPKLCAPINQTMWGSFHPVIEEETPLADYFNVIGGRDLWDMDFYANKLAYRTKALKANLHDLFRVSRPSGAIGEMIYNSPLSFFMPNPMKDITQTANKSFF